MPTYVDGEIPSGVIDGSNTSFTLAHSPNPAGSLILESDSSTLAPGVGFTLVGANLTLVAPPLSSLVAWYRYDSLSTAAPLYKLVVDKTSDDNAFTSIATAINSTYTTYGFVNAAKSTQNPLLGFHRKRFAETQMYMKGSGQATLKAFPNYILKQDGVTFNPFVYTAPPIVLQTDPPDDIVRPLNISGNRVFIMYSTNAVGAAFSISKTILCGNIDSFNTVNPNA